MGLNVTKNNLFDTTFEEYYQEMKQRNIHQKLLYNIKKKKYLKTFNIGYQSLIKSKNYYMIETSCCVSAINSVSLLLSFLGERLKGRERASD